MTSTDLGFLALGVLALLAVGLVSLVARRFRRDEIFLGVTPGVIPADPGSARRGRVTTGQEYAGEVAVAFAPPRGLTPGLVGTVVDGRVESRDLTATLVDLAVRGHLKITAIPADGAPHPARRKFARRPQPTEAPKVDWELQRATTPPADALADAEARLVTGLFRGKARVRMSGLDEAALQAMREVQVELYREVVNRRWYPRHPQQKATGPGCLWIGIGLGLGLLFLVARPTWVGLVAGLLILAAFVLLPRALRGRTPRTAEGTAVRIQSLGFKKYLETAEADQFRFEEAAGIFSRYLPYAMVFGVAHHWAKIFGELAREAQATMGADAIAFDLTWFDVAALNLLDVGTDMLWWDGLDGSFDLFDGDAFLAFGGDAVEGLTSMATGLGDFMGSLDFLDGLGEGCGDLDGCIDF